MHDHATTPPARSVTLADLVRRYGDAWEIRQQSCVWTAEYRSGDGRHIRYLAAHSLAEMAVKLGSASTVEP